MQHPLELARLKQDPCSVLTPAQVSGLIGADAQGVPTVHIADEPRCTWKNHGLLIQFSIPVRHGNGLADIERSYTDHRPLPPIRGYPTAGFGPHDNGTCALALGVNDHATAEATVATPAGHTGPDPCRTAHDVLDNALDNLQQHHR